ncbi:MAG: hypothetical protein QOE90_754 [Thermoplasmata archaeon]|nr:hypothetical protein [Thermoplasmata archaeon]
MSRAALLVLALLLAAPLASLVPAASACATSGVSLGGVPCGRIYPVITITSAGPSMTNLTANKTVQIHAKVDWSFRMLGDGYAPVAPTDPIQITFEFPRKPAWVDMKVQPDALTVNTQNPTSVQPDPTNAAGPEAMYDQQFDVTVSITLVDRAVLRDGYDYAKLLVFAKSSENSLYQSGYGIKEFRVAPENPLHDGDLTPDVYAVTPVANFTAAPATGQAAGEKVTLTPPAKTSFWVPQVFSAQIDPAPAGKVVAALHDEAGDLVYATQPMDAAGGKVQFTATLARPGLTTATFTLLPDAKGATPPVTIPVSFVAGDVKPEGFSFPKDYAVVDQGLVPAPGGSADALNALNQFQRDVPFFVFDSAQAVTATLTLETPGQSLDRGAASLNMQLLDPEGKVLQTASVDPVQTPSKPLRVGSVPVEGWYTIRVQGAGVPAGSAWDTKIEVAYATAPQTRNHADGAPDWTAQTLTGAGHNVTLPFAALAPWKPGDVTPKLEGMANARYDITVFGPQGALAYASGLRGGTASFSAPEAGVYRAFVYVEPTLPGLAFSPTVRAFTFGVGANTTTVAQTYEIHDALEIPQAPAGAIVGVYAFPAAAGAPAPTLTLASDQPGVTLTTETQDANGTKVYVVHATNPGPAATGAATAKLQFAAAQTLVGPLALAGAPAGKGVAGLGVAATLLALLGAAAVGIAVALVRKT